MPQQRIVTATRCLYPECLEVLRLQETLFFLLKGWTFIFLMSLGFQHDFYEGHRRAQLEDVVGVNSPHLTDFRVICKCIVTLLASTRQLYLPHREVKTVLVALSSTCLLQSDVRKFDALDFVFLLLVEVVYHKLEHLRVLLFDYKTDDV